MSTIQQEIESILFDSENDREFELVDSIETYDLDSYYNEDYPSYIYDDGSVEYGDNYTEGL